MISMIWAMDRNGLIGKGNNMPWRLPEDWVNMKKTTMGHPIIMGRKTFESIGGKALPGRLNVVVTRNSDFSAEGFEVCHSIDEALKYGEKDEAFIFGGADIYKAFIPYADRLYVTLIDHEFVGDTYFPEVDYNDWKLVSKVQGKQDKKNLYIYYFLIYERKR